MPLLVPVLSSLYSRQSAGAHHGEPATPGALLETLPAAEARETRGMKLQVQKSAEMKPLVDNGRWRARVSTRAGQVSERNDRINSGRLSQDRNESSKGDARRRCSRRFSIEPLVEEEAACPPMRRKTETDCRRARTRRDSRVPRVRLQRVLLIGDSILIGYTARGPQVVAGQGETSLYSGERGAHGVGLANHEGWLGDGKWAVIHLIRACTTPSTVADGAARLARRCRRNLQTMPSNSKRRVRKRSSRRRLRCPKCLDAGRRRSPEIGWFRTALRSCTRWQSTAMTRWA